MCKKLNYICVKVYTLSFHIRKSEVHTAQRESGTSSDDEHTAKQESDTSSDDHETNHASSSSTDIIVSTYMMQNNPNLHEYDCVTSDRQLGEGSQEIYMEIS